MRRLAAGMRDTTPLRAYRIVKRRFIRTAFSGEGARLYGGRWNSPGVRVVYLASSISLAVLEWRAHLSQWPAPTMVIIEVEFDADLVWSPAKLPAHWNRTPYGSKTTAIGDEWVRSQRSVVLKVPSAIVSQECNFLLNPAHPDFHRISIGQPHPFRPDPRLGPF